MRSIGLATLQLSLLFKTCLFWVHGKGFVGGAGQMRSQVLIFGSDFILSLSRKAVLVYMDCLPGPTTSCFQEIYDSSSKICRILNYRICTKEEKEEKEQGLAVAVSCPFLQTLRKIPWNRARQVSQMLVATWIIQSCFVGQKADKTLIPRKSMMDEREPKTQVNTAVSAVTNYFL